MRSYSYTFYDKDGKIKKKYVNAYSLSEAEYSLIQQGITLIDIDECENIPQKPADLESSDTFKLAPQSPQAQKLKPAKPPSGFSFRSIFARNINYDEFIIFLREFTALIKSGVTLLASLDLLAQYARDPILKKALHGVVNEIYNGSTMYGAFNKQKDVFPKIFVNLLYAGETGGNLAKIMQDLSDYYEKEREIRKKALSALTYPAVVLAFALLAVLFLTCYIFPGFISIYKNFNIELPLPTKVLIFFVDCVRNPYILLTTIAGLFFLYVLFNNYRKTPAGKYNFDVLMTGVPVINNILKKIMLARFARTLGTLYDDGISLHKSLEITNQIIDNAFYKSEIEKIINEIVDTGVPLSGAMAKKPAVFPVIFVNMAAAGEESGDIGYMLKKIALYYEEEIFYIFDNFVSIIEPVIIVVLGSAVLFIMLSLFLPLYNLISQFTTAG